jgi:Amt family ammonium transporter
MRHFFLPALCLLVLVALLSPGVDAHDESDAPKSANMSVPAETTVDDRQQENDDDGKAEEKVEIDTGDNAWMLICAALVLFMTAPGLAMFYGGLVRRKNILGVLMQCIFLMGLMSIVWCLWGYSLCFGGEGGLLGNLDFLLMKDVQLGWSDAPNVSGAVIEMEGSIPRLTHMLFQGMFFIITPALICGAFAERMKFSTMAVFMVLWGTFVYCPLCHMFWDGGLLASWGAQDFAGGAVVHISSGCAALVCALMIGNRLGHGSDPMPPHNLTYTAIGTAMLWFGWFGFNAGSALAANGLAASAFAATHLSAAAGTLTWACIEWYKDGKPTVLGACSGAIAGLACITPASGFVSPMSAILVGILAGTACYFACTSLKSRFGYDDSLDVFGIHGIGGMLGMLLTGVFASRAVQDLNQGQPVGLIEGGGTGLLGIQLLAVLFTILLTVVFTFILLWILDRTMGLRVSQDEEMEGLDLSLHGEEGYINLP